MLRTLTRASAAAVLMAWAMPAAALECSDYAELLDSNVARPVLQSIVLESPPEDGWACLTATRHSVTSSGTTPHLDRVLARLDAVLGPLVRRTDAPLHRRRTHRRNERSRSFSLSSR